MADKKTSKWDNFKQKIAYARYKTREWCNDNKDILIAIVPAVIASSVTTANIISRRRNTNEIKELKNRKMYDNVNGWYCTTKRKLRSHELVEVSRRHKNGETITEILDDMRLLK